jgi:hypothetical protein
MMKECCQKQENRVDVELRSGMIVQQCKVCGCKHYEMRADPGVIFAKPSG